MLIKDPYVLMIPFLPAYSSLLQCITESITFFETHLQDIAGCFQPNGFQLVHDSVFVLLPKDAKKELCDMDSYEDWYPDLTMDLFPEFLQRWVIRRNTWPQSLEIWIVGGYLYEVGTFASQLKVDFLARLNQVKL